MNLVNMFCLLKRKFQIFPFFNLYGALFTRYTSVVQQVIELDHSQLSQPTLVTSVKAHKQDRISTDSKKKTKRKTDSPSTSYIDIKNISKLKLAEPTQSSSRDREKWGNLESHERL